jgi:hypothetical protein
MNLWTRNSDGTWQRDGWTIKREHNKGSGQARPFQHVNTKAYDAWIVRDPNGFERTGAATLASAKANGNRQIELRAQS